MKLLLGTASHLYKYVKNQMCKVEPFVFVLSYSDEYSKEYEELNRFRQQALEKHARFKNEYVGSSVIDLTEWAEMPVNSKFESFLYYLLDRKLENKKNQIMFISEKPISNAIISSIEEVFDEILDVIDLGFKGSIKGCIGFQVNDKDGDEVVRG